MKRLILGLVVGLILGVGSTVIAQSIGRPGAFAQYYKRTSPGERSVVEGFSLDSGDGLITYHCYNSFYVMRFNDGGTVRYKYLDLAGTSTTWQHSTSTPCTTP